MHKKGNFVRTLACAALFASTSAHALVISFEASDFTLNPIFSNVQTFEFEIDVADPLLPGMTYNNPGLNGVDYHVFGTLDVTPSGFFAFDLNRSIGGTEFYTQGSSLSFEISATANLSDGLQVSDLAGTGTVFEFNGREVGTGRYHPALFQLNSDGTGSIRNSNNMGGINPGSGLEVDVTFGEEYITEFTFDPTALTLAPTVPEPRTLLPIAIVGGFFLRAARRKKLKNEA